jgi:hypothetical protein
VEVEALRAREANRTSVSPLGLREPIGVLAAVQVAMPTYCRADTARCLVLSPISPQYGCMVTGSTTRLSLQLLQ